MKKSLLTIALFTTMNGFAQDKAQCKITAWNNSTLCWRHNPDYVKKDANPTVICSAKTKSNTNCKQKTSHPSGVCHHHRPKN